MKKFTKNNTGFVCINCKENIKPHTTTSRDHCTKCLYSLHVDINPGDRANTCKGILVPIGLKVNSNKRQIVYECNKCLKKTFNLVSEDDSFEEIVKLSSKVYTL